MRNCDDDIPADLEDSVPFSQNFPIIGNMFQAMAYENGVLAFGGKREMCPVISGVIEFYPYGMINHRERVRHPSSEANIEDRSAREICRAKSFSGPRLTQSLYARSAWA